jgi:hypothetical protein
MCIENNGGGLLCSLNSLNHSNGRMQPGGTYAFDLVIERAIERDQYQVRPAQDK